MFALRFSGDNVGMGIGKGNVTKTVNLGIYFKIVSELLKLITKGCIIPFSCRDAAQQEDGDMKKWIALAGIMIFTLCAFWPRAAFTEDTETILLARAIYALGHAESYETKLAIGSLAMNRVDNPWFGDTLDAVLTEQHQFPLGRRYDSASLAAAHEVLSGRRALPAQALYYQSTVATAPRQDEPVKSVGGFTFYATQAEAQA